MGVSVRFAASATAPDGQPIRIPPRGIRRHPPPVRQAGRMQRIAAEPLDVLRTRTSAKWRSFPADVLPLPVAEMDYPLAEPIARALHAAVDRSDTGYSSGSRPVAEAFQGFAAARLGWDVDPARVTCTADVSLGNVEVLRRVTEPGDGVIITPPVYHPFFDLLPEAGCSVVEVPLLGGIDEGWSARPRRDRRGVRGRRPRDAALQSAQPDGHGPGCRDARRARRHRRPARRDDRVRRGAWTLAQPATPYTPFLTVSDAAREHGVAVTAATKAFNLAGLKTALIVTASDRGDRVRGRPAVRGRVADEPVRRDRDDRGLPRGRPVARRRAREPRRQPPPARRPCRRRAAGRPLPHPRRDATSPGSTSQRSAGATTRAAYALEQRAHSSPVATTPRPNVFVVSVAGRGAWRRSRRRRR